MPARVAYPQSIKHRPSATNLLPIAALPFQLFESKRRASSAKASHLPMKLRRIFDSVVTRLLFLGLCIAIFAFFARYYALSSFLREDLTKVVEGQQLALATYVARDVEDKIIQRQALLEHIAASLPVGLLAQPERLRAWLKERYEYQPLFSAGLFVVNVKGAVLARYPALPVRTNINYADRDYIQAGLAGRSLVGRSVIGRAANEPVLPIAVPIRSWKNEGRNEGRNAGRNEVQAVLVGVTALAAPEFLNGLLQSRIGNATGGFLLVSPQDKLFVASSQPDMVLKPTPPPGVNALHDRAMAGFRGTGVTVNAKGIEEVSAIVSVPSAGWFVVARLPTSEAFATVGRTQHFLVKNTALAIFLYLSIAGVGLYFVIRPLFRAAENAERMTQGELPLQALPIVRNDEVGHLISAFNRLLGKLNDNEAELMRIAHHDTLTGLPNRGLLTDRLHQALALAQRKDTHIGLLYMDLDGFKQINDTLGHDAGDEALRQIARRFSKLARQADTLARIGGDEFVLLLNDLEDDAEEAASVVASRYIDALKTPILISSTPCTLGVSIGIAIGNGESSSDELLLAADRAMYQAKETGRDRYVVTVREPIERPVDVGYEVGC